MIGIIAGTSLIDSKLIKGRQLNGRKRTVETPFGSVEAVMLENAMLIDRHRGLPPHRINHKANIFAFKAMKIDEVVGIASCGSLKKKISPPCLVVPHDFMQLTDIPTFFDDEIKHITPSFNEQLRQRLIKTAKKTGLKVHEKGVYVQTSGPRLETRAEVRFLKDYADVVGMTIASEATLANELELKYACVCNVDNYAHGVVKEVPTYEKIIENVKKNQSRIEMMVRELVNHRD